MRVWLAVPLVCLVTGYVGLSVSLRRQKRRYIVDTRAETMRLARCFSDDVEDYRAAPDASDSLSEEALCFTFCPVKGADVAGAPCVIGLPASFVDDSGPWKLEALYDLYCHVSAIPAASPLEEALTQNLRDALRAVLEHRLAAMSSPDTASLSPEDACNTMAMAALVRRLPVPVRLDAHVYQQARRQFERDGSTSWSVLVFVRSLAATCGWRALSASCAVLLFQSAALDFLSPTYMTGTATLCFSELVRHQSLLPEEVRWTDFVLSMLTATTADSAGQLLAASMLLDAARTVLSTVRDAVGNLILHQHNDRIRAAAILAVARMDYTPDTDWPVPEHVYGALSSVTNFTFSSVDYWVASVLERADLWMTCAAHPLEAAVLWTVQQGLVRLESLVGQYENLVKHMAKTTAARSTSPRPASPSADQTEESGRTQEVNDSTTHPHYGLTLWLEAAAEETCGDGGRTDTLWNVAAVTRYPFATEADRQLTARTVTAMLTHVPAGPQVAGIAHWLRRKAALLASTALPSSDALATTTTVEASRKAWAGFPGGIDGVSLHLSRHHGLTATAVVAPHGQKPLPSESKPSDATDTARAVVDELLHSCESLPVLAVLLVATPTSTDASPSATAASLERLLQTAADSDRPFLFGALSPFSYAVHSLRHSYWSRSDYAQSMRYLSRVIVTPPAIDNAVAQPLLPLPPCPWSIAFEHVWFRYPGAASTTAKWALEDVSFTLPVGGFLGIIGFSGAGKTSILLLIARLYAPTRGRILLNGHPIESFPARALRRQLAHSWQAATALRFLEACTVETNVALGHLATASTASVRAALQHACALDFVDSRARGLKNRLDPNTLSGGEVERLSLARTFMKDAQHAGLYLLDECTSAMDSSTGEAVLQPLFNSPSHTARTTCIMVTHRLSSIRGADLILVLDNGRVAEQGSWTNLVAAHERSTAQPTLFGTLLLSQSKSSTR